MHVVDRTGGKRGGYGRERGGLGNAEAYFLAFHTAHVLIQPHLFQSGISREFRSIAGGQSDEKDGEHDGEDGFGFTAQHDTFLPAFLFRLLPAAISHHQAEHDDEGAGQKHHGQHFKHAGEHVGVFQRGS